MHADQGHAVVKHVRACFVGSDEEEFVDVCRGICVQALHNCEAGFAV